MSSTSFYGVALRPHALLPAARLVRRAFERGRVAAWFFQRCFEEDEVRVRFQSSEEMGKEIARSLGGAVLAPRPYELEIARLGGESCVPAIRRFFRISSVLAIAAETAAPRPSLLRAMPLFLAMRELMPPGFFARHVHALRGQRAPMVTLAGFSERYPELVTALRRAVGRRPPVVGRDVVGSRWRSSLHALAKRVQDEEPLFVHLHLAANRVGLLRNEETLLALAFDDVWP